MVVPSAKAFDECAFAANDVPPSTHGVFGEVITSFDWSRTAMGPESEWSSVTRSVVDAGALSPLATISVWGSQALTLYNDAFALIAGDLHPRLLGQSIITVWPAAAPLFQSIRDATTQGRRLRLTNQPLVFRRDGVDETRHFDLICGSIVDDRSCPTGFVCVLVEDGRPPHAHPFDSRLSLLLAVADEFRFAARRDEIIAIALRSIALETGAVSMGYADVDLVHDEATFEDGEGLPACPRRSGSLAVARLVPGLGKDLHAGRSVVVDHEGIEAPEALAPLCSRLVVPFIREGRLLALFLWERPGRTLWTAADIGFVEDIAHRAWEAIERVRSAATLRRNQARQGFLLVLGDRLRELDNPDEIMETTAESVGRHLKVSRAGYGEISRTGDIFFGTGWSDGSVTPLVGGFPLTGLGAAHVADLTRGLTSTFDADASQMDAPAVIQDLRTVMAVPLNRDGKLRGALFLGSVVDRTWSADEVGLVGEVAARLWEALERARAEAALHDLNVTLENRVAQRTQELTTSEARFRTLFTNAPAPIFLIRVSPGGEAVYDAINAATATFMGQTSREMVGHPVAQLTSTGTPLLDHCLRSAETGLPVEYQISVESEGRRRTAECVLAPLPIDDDDTQLLIGIARDITAQRQVEEQLRQAQKMEAIGQLTGGIAHDFNNLLTGIIGSLALMEKRLAQGKTEVLARYLGLAMTSANRAAALTHRLLAFSRRQPLESKPVDTASLVVSMDDLLRRTLGEHVDLHIRQPDVPWLTLCDHHQLENALLNLAINARDAMPDGGRLTLKTTNLTIDARSKANEPGIVPGDYVVLAVTDTGIGMPPDVIARAFDPFFTTKPIGQGTGLGLSMIYGFAKQSEGHVKIESEVGRGTTVKIFLPRYIGRTETPAEETTATIPRAEAGETVLVVEDDATVRDLVLEVLKDLGYLAVEAGDGPEGLKVIHSDARIDLLITDVGLPGMNGRQLAEQARAHRPDLSVLFITGYAENAAFGAGHLESGMQMMTKPFALDELATRIRSILKASETVHPHPLDR